MESSYYSVIKLSRGVDTVIEVCKQNNVELIKLVDKFYIVKHDDTYLPFFKDLSDEFDIFNRGFGNGFFEKVLRSLSELNIKIADIDVGELEHEETEDLELLFIKKDFGGYANYVEDNLIDIYSVEFFVGNVDVVRIYQYCVWMAFENFDVVVEKLREAFRLYGE